MVLFFDESETNVLCADHVDEFHVTVIRRSLTPDTEKYCLFRMQLYPGNEFTLELNYLREFFK